jgi:GDPmannose 4,6-dehydratase
MLQHAEPDDYVIATGEAHSVRELVELAFGLLDLDWKQHVELDPRYRRPAEVDNLRGDASKALRILGWSPRVTFAELIKMMIASDLELAAQERTLADAGHVLPQRGTAAR